MRTLVQIRPKKTEPALTALRSIRHNELRDLTTSLLTEVCNDVCVEPTLQLITTEVMTRHTANTTEGVRLDVAVNGFWGGRYERSFLDVRVSLIPPPTRTHQLRNASRSMNRRKRGHMSKESLTLNMPLLRLLSSQPVVGSVRKLPPSIRDSPLSSLINGTSPTAPQ